MLFINLVNGKFLQSSVMDSIFSSRVRLDLIFIHMRFLPRLMYLYYIGSSDSRVVSEIAGFILLTRAVVGSNLYGTSHDIIFSVINCL